VIQAKSEYEQGRLARLQALVQAARQIKNFALLDDLINRAQAYAEKDTGKRQQRRRQYSDRFSRRDKQE
jgi:hypothetical protein